MLKEHLEILYYGKEEIIMANAVDNSILKSVRSALGLPIDDDSFDSELVMYINSALGVLNQNGVGKTVIVTDDTQNWEDFKDVEQTKGNKLFLLVQMYVFVKTKLLFDPPPPSNVQYVSTASEENLWRLREEYAADNKEVKP